MSDQSIYYNVRHENFGLTKLEITGIKIPQLSKEIERLAQRIELRFYTDVYGNVIPSRRKRIQA